MGRAAFFRHNTLQDYCVGWHGADSPGPINSSLQHEVMHNTFTVTNGVAQAFCCPVSRRDGVQYLITRLTRKAAVDTIMCLLLSITVRL